MDDLGGKPTIFRKHPHHGHDSKWFSPCNLDICVIWRMLGKSSKKTHYESSQRGWWVWWWWITQGTLKIKNHHKSKETNSKNPLEKWDPSGRRWNFRVGLRPIFQGASAVLGRELTKWKQINLISPSKKTSHQSLLWRGFQHAPFKKKMYIISATY